MDLTARRVPAIAALLVAAVALAAAPGSAAVRLTPAAAAAAQAAARGAAVPALGFNDFCFNINTDIKGTVAGPMQFCVYDSVRARRAACRAAPHAQRRPAPRHALVSARRAALRGAALRPSSHPAVALTTARLVSPVPATARPASLYYAARRRPAATPRAPVGALASPFPLWHDRAPNHVRSSPARP